MKRIIPIAIGVMCSALLSSAAFAHVIVTPGQVGVGQELVFNISAPNEQSTPVIDVKVEVPSGVTNVVPTTKPGWTIKTEQSGSGDSPTITAIEWTGGEIPVGQREDFSFSAQVPGNAGDLNWKAFQTYADKTVVHWDQTPNGKDDSVNNAGPYSITHIVNDLSTKKSDPISTRASIALGLGALGVILGLAALMRRR